MNRLKKGAHTDASPLEIAVVGETFAPSRSRVQWESPKELPLPPLPFLVHLMASNWSPKPPYASHGGRENAVGIVAAARGDCASVATARAWRLRVATAYLRAHEIDCDVERLPRGGLAAMKGNRWPDLAVARLVGPPRLPVLVQVL